MLIAKLEILKIFSASAFLDQKGGFFFKKLLQTQEDLRIFCRIVALQLLIRRLQLKIVNRNSEIPNCFILYSTTANQSENEEFFIK
jgi:hypothetical protein